jgi:SHS2 domain-containing protein
MKSNRGYETFDHTADIGIRAWGSEFSQVFEEAAKALFSVMADLKTVSPRQKVKIELAKDSGEELFLAWLKELLFIFETRRLLLCEFKILDLTSHSLSAEVRGETLDNSKHSLGREVKAITLHQFKLTKDQGRCLAEVILDI